MGMKFFKLIDNQPEDIALQSEVINSVSQKGDTPALILITFSHHNV